MTNLQAALGLAQLEKINYHIIRKREIGNKYLEGLKELKGFQLPLSNTTYADNIFWVFGLVADSEEMKNQIVKKLYDAGIGTRPFFWCMHEQPVFLKMGLLKNECYPVAEKLARNGFYLPSGLGLQNTEIDFVTKIINT
jgi:perosamine synthetase